MEKQYKVLIADDEPDIIEFLQYNLENSGFRVFTSNNGKHALESAIVNKPDLIILDIMMPEIDGIEVCRELREMPGFNDVIIVFLTARNEDYSQIAGFEVGADDYITKPVKPRVLMARLHALLKRAHSLSSEEDTLLNFGKLTIDKEKRLVLVEGKQHMLPRKEYEIVFLLASKVGKVFTREEIYHKIWGSVIVVGDRTIDVHIRKIRERIGEDFIQTIKGIGYKFHSIS